MTISPLLTVDRVSKAFDGTQAVREVSLWVNRGEIVGLAGENGAGKSTLLSIASCLIAPDAGEVLIDGHASNHADYHEANRRGIFRVYQEQALLPNLSVYENLFVGHERHFATLGVLRRRKMIARAAAELRETINREIDVKMRVSDLPWGERQLVEVARAVALSKLLSIEAPLILLDEPTAAMTHDELEEFYALLRRLKGSYAFLFVSHRLGEVLDLSDRVYVLKDGALVGEISPGEVTERDLHALMVGREREAEYYREEEQVTEVGEVVLEVDGASSAPAFADVSFVVRAGEIVGVGGVTASGATELGRVLAGVISLDAGRIVLVGQDVSASSVAGRIRYGLGYLPIDRHAEGVILGQSVSINTTLTALDRVATRLMGIRSVARERRATRQIIDRLHIVTPSERTTIDRLSGGNQQKVVFGRQLLAQAKVLVLDNPTRGVDAGAKYEIYGLLRELSKAGVGILIISADLPELIGLSNRLLILRDGRVALEAQADSRKKPPEAELVRAMVSSSDERQ